MLAASADFCFFSVFITTRSDGNIYLEYHIWIFYEKQPNAKGGIHERSGNIRDLANHAKPTEGKGGALPTPPNSANHAKPAYHAKPSQSFLTKIPLGHA